MDDFSDMFDNAQDLLDLLQQMDKQLPLTDAIRDKSKPFMMGNDMPHYTDKRFQHGRTVYLDPGYKLKGDDDFVEGLTYQYSDRLVQFNYEKARAAMDLAKADHPYPCTPAMYERYLQLYYEDDSLQLIHVVSGFNWSSGYPYQCFGYIRESE